MAECHDTVVDPERGVYVEIEGIMEVRWSSDYYPDPDYYRKPEDFKHFQERVR